MSRKHVFLNTATPPSRQEAARSAQYSPMLSGSLRQIYTPEFYPDTNTLTFPRYQAYVLLPSLPIRSLFSLDGDNTSATKSGAP